MAFQFQNWLFKQLPEYYHTTDTNLDANKEGTLNRYLQTFGLEYDTQIMPYLYSFLDIFDIQKTDDKYLNYLAYLLGTPPSFGDNASYRKILAHIISIYKIKGTSRSFELFFNLLGLRVSVIEEMPSKGVNYDQGFKYDQGNKYDTFCDMCSGYWLAVSSIADTPDLLTVNAVPQATLNKINPVLCFLQPINATFKGMIVANRLYESTTLTLTETHNP